MFHCFNERRCMQMWRSLALWGLLLLLAGGDLAVVSGCPTRDLQQLKQCLVPIHHLRQMPATPSVHTCRTIETFIRCVLKKQDACGEFIASTRVLHIAAGLKTRYCASLPATTPESTTTTTTPPPTVHQLFDSCRQQYKTATAARRSLRQACSAAKQFLECGQSVLWSDTFDLETFQLHAELLRNRAVFWKHCARRALIRGGVGTGMCPYDVSTRLASCIGVTYWEPVVPGDVKTFCKVTVEILPCLTALANGCHHVPRLQSIANFMWSSFQLLSDRCGHLLPERSKFEYEYGDYDYPQGETSSPMPVFTPVAANSKPDKPSRPKPATPPPDAEKPKPTTLSADVEKPEPTIPSSDVEKPKPATPPPDVKKPKPTTPTPDIEKPKPTIPSPDVEKPKPSTPSPDVEKPKPTTPSPDVEETKPTTPSPDVEKPKPATPPDVEKPKPTTPSDGKKPKSTAPSPDVERPKPSTPSPDVEETKPTTTSPDVEKPKPSTPSPDVEKPKPTTPSPDVEKPKPTTPSPDVEKPKPSTPSPDVEKPKPTIPSSDVEKPKPTTPSSDDVEKPKPTTPSPDAKTPEPAISPNIRNRISATLRDVQKPKSVTPPDVHKHHKPSPDAKKPEPAISPKVKNRISATPPDVKKPKLVTPPIAHKHKPPDKHEPEPEPDKITSQKQPQGRDDGERPREKSVSASGNQTEKWGNKSSESAQKADNAGKGFAERAEAAESSSALSSTTAKQSLSATGASTESPENQTPPRSHQSPHAPVLPIQTTPQSADSSTLPTQAGNNMTSRQGDAEVNQYVSAQNDRELKNDDEGEAALEDELHDSQTTGVPRLIQAENPANLSVIGSLTPEEKSDEFPEQENDQGNTTVVSDVGEEEEADTSTESASPVAAEQNFNDPKANNNKDSNKSPPANVSIDVQSSSMSSVMTTEETGLNVPDQILPMSGNRTEPPEDKPASGSFAVSSTVSPSNTTPIIQPSNESLGSNDAEPVPDEEFIPTESPAINTESTVKSRQDTDPDSMKQNNISLLKSSESSASENGSAQIKGLMNPKRTEKQARKDTAQNPKHSEDKPAGNGEKDKTKQTETLSSEHSSTTADTRDSTTVDEPDTTTTLPENQTGQSPKEDSQSLSPAEADSVRQVTDTMDMTISDIITTFITTSKGEGKGEGPAGPEDERQGTVPTPAQSANQRAKEGSSGPSGSEEKEQGQTAAPWGEKCSKPWEGHSWCTAIMMQARLASDQQMCRALEQYISCLKELLEACRGFSPFGTITNTVDYVTGVFDFKCADYHLPEEEEEEEVMILPRPSPSLSP
ncbi:uncharacterized protein LOC143288702 [Babylonia areolata]|uniref:uncharacterized protein LOC143288702 n=1 Tax=Babylonia areolata TaxID=304850 RepID=UPI003FD48046